MSIFSNIKNRIRFALHWDLLNELHELRSEVAALNAKVTASLNEIHDLKLLPRALGDSNGFGKLSLMLHNLHVLPKYEHVFYEIKDGDICIDCGANQGLFTDVIAFQNGICHSFEPNPLLFSLLKRKFSSNPNVFLNFSAVSKENGEIDFILAENINEHFLEYIEGGSISQDIHYAEEQKGRPVHYCKVKQIRLVDYLQDNILNQNQDVYILKLDVEGAEFDIVEDLIESNVFEHCKYIFVETHARHFTDGEERLERIKALILDRNISNIFLDWQ